MCGYTQAYAAVLCSIRLACLVCYLFYVIVFAILLICAILLWVVVVYSVKLIMYAIYFMSLFCTILLLYAILLSAGCCIMWCQTYHVRLLIYVTVLCYTAKCCLWYYVGSCMYTI